MKNKLKIILLGLPLMLTNQVQATGFNNLDGNLDNNVGKLQNVLGLILNLVRWSSLGVCIIMIVWCAAKLAMSAGNTQKKAAAMEGMKNTIIAIAILGSLSLISQLAYGLLHT